MQLFSLKPMYICYILISFIAPYFLQTGNKNMQNTLTFRKIQCRQPGGLDFNEILSNILYPAPYP